MEIKRTHKNTYLKLDEKVEDGLGSMGGRDPRMNAHIPWVICFRKNWKSMMELNALAWSSKVAWCTLLECWVGRKRSKMPLVKTEIGRKEIPRSMTRRVQDSKFSAKNFQGWFWTRIVDMAQTLLVKKNFWKF